MPFTPSLPWTSLSQRTTTTSFPTKIHKEQNRLKKPEQGVQPSILLPPSILPLRCQNCSVCKYRLQKNYMQRSDWQICKSKYYEWWILKSVRLGDNGVNLKKCAQSTVIQGGYCRFCKYKPNSFTVSFPSEISIDMRLVGLMLLSIFLHCAPFVPYIHRLRKVLGRAPELWLFNGKDSLL